MVKIGLSLISLLLVTSIMVAQPISSVTPEIMLEVADEKFAENDYYNAVDWYEQSYKELRQPEIAIRIADLHYMLRDYKRAESWYSRILKRDKDNIFVEAKYKYA